MAVTNKSSGWIYQTYDKVVDTLGSGVKSFVDLAQPIVNNNDKETADHFSVSAENKSSDYVAAVTSSAPKLPERNSNLFVSKYAAVAQAEEYAVGLGHQDAAGAFLSGGFSYVSSDADTEKTDKILTAAIISSSAFGLTILAIIGRALLNNHRLTQQNNFTEREIGQTLKVTGDEFKNDAPRVRLRMAALFHEELKRIYGDPNLAYDALLEGLYSNTRPERLAALRAFYTNAGLKISEQALQRVDGRINRFLIQNSQHIVLHPPAAMAMLFRYGGDFSANRKVILEIYRGMGAYFHQKTGKPAAALMRIIEGYESASELPAELGFLMSGNSGSSFGDSSQRAHAKRLMIAAASAQLVSESHQALYGTEEFSTQIFVNYAESLGMEAGAQQLVAALLDDDATPESLKISKHDFKVLKGLARTCQKTVDEILSSASQSDGELTGFSVDLRNFDRFFQLMDLPSLRYHALFNGDMLPQDFINQLKTLLTRLQLGPARAQGLLSSAAKVAQLGKLNRSFHQTRSLDNFLQLFIACQNSSNSHRDWMTDLIERFRQGEPINTIAHNSLDPYLPDGVSVDHFDEGVGRLLAESLSALELYVINASNHGGQKPSERMKKLGKILGFDQRYYRAVFAKDGRARVEAKLEEGVESAFTALEKLAKQHSQAFDTLIAGLRSPYPGLEGIYLLESDSGRLAVQQEALRNAKTLPGSYLEERYTALGDPRLTPLEVIAGVRAMIHGLHNESSLTKIVAGSYRDFIHFIRELPGLDPEVKLRIKLILPEVDSPQVKDFEDAARAELANRALQAFEASPYHDNANKLVDVLILMQVGVTADKDSDLYNAAREDILNRLETVSRIDLQGDKGTTIRKFELSFAATAALSRYAKGQVGEPRVSVAVGGPRLGVAAKNHVLQIRRLGR